MPKYNSSLDPDRQITAEEKIAAYIFDHAEGVNEEDAAKCGRAILLLVLEEFRPDLFEK
jgi:hypothetical protein